MLIIRETHQVHGKLEDDFEAAVRDEWMPALGRSDDARLLFYMNLAHGTGLSYRVVTYTWVRDGAAYERLARSIDAGELRPVAQKLDELRHEVEGKVLIPVPWSPLQEIDPARIPTTPQDHELTMFIEDTVWPDEGKLEAYVDASGSQLVGQYKESFPEEVSFGGQTKGKVHLVDFEAGYRPAFGSHRRRELILWQRIIQPDAFWAMIRSDTPEEFKKPGRWMVDALELRDQWQSRLLRAARWSPWS